MSVKVRFAPSPTGFLHIGNVRTALINWLFSQKMQGQFLLRMDDTDQARNEARFETAILEDLAWLGITHTELAHQSARLRHYQKAAEQLKDMGRLYPCYETQDELAFKRKRALSQGLPPIYDRAARTLTDTSKKQYEAEGRKPHWRFLLADGSIEWNDLVRGPTHFEGKHLSDPVLIREDGLPVYTLASVVDDIDFNITHIIRAEDHVANTAIQIQLFQSLGKHMEDMHFAHPPLISNADGSGFSKREGSLSIRDLRAQGILPSAIVDVLGRLGTSLPIEPYATPAPLIQTFSFENFARATPKFSVEELEAINTKVLRALSFAEATPYLPKDMPITEDFWQKISPNLTHMRDITEWHTLCFGTPVGAVSSEDRAFIEQALSLLPAEEEGLWEKWISEVKAKTGRTGKSLFMPLRQALTGAAHGPDLNTLTVCMGREGVALRLTHALR